MADRNLESQTWSIIVFGLNEGPTLEDLVEKTQSVLKQISPKKSEILIVDDGSTDETPAIANRLKARYPNVVYIQHPRNLGIGPALRSGYANASLENCCAIPADGQFNPDELLPFAKIPQDAFVSFYRDKKTGYTFFRERLSQANRSFNQSLLGMSLRDVNWVKAYKTASLRNLQLRLKSSLIESEICAKLLLSGFRVLERESVYHARRAGVARGASFKTIARAANETLKLTFAVALFRWSRRVGSESAAEPEASRKSA